MKLNIISIYIVFSMLLVSCANDFLDRAPISEITPANYLTDETHLAAYTIACYGPTNGWNIGDRDTDSQAAIEYSHIFVPGEWKVPASGGWSFSSLYNYNYFLETVVPRYHKGQITGNDSNIKHYIGEMYLFRAMFYFDNLKTYGDFPIITKVLPDDRKVLTEASKRQPRTEVARFILSDLDSAIYMMKTVSPDGNKNRLSKLVALQFKSRVALFEGTFLKYFSGTAFVPNGPGWPGKAKSYNSDFRFQSGSIDGEIEFFLNEAMQAAKEVADQIDLVENNQVMTQTLSDPLNPYCEMFSSENMSGFEEVLMWKDFDSSLGISTYAGKSFYGGNFGVGLTRGMVESFVMKNGLPIYADGSGYMGDESLESIPIDRDSRLSLFLKVPGQVKVLYNTPVIVYEGVPDILANHEHQKYTTGYAHRKGLNLDNDQNNDGRSTQGEISFRAVEAYLNYIEACYERQGSLDNKAIDYWRKIRRRAGVDEDFQKTINATDLHKEAPGDWAVYSAGEMIDPILYNIRRERRCELMGEGLRAMDLRRWRSIDQLINIPYHIEGFKLWGTMQHWYDPSQLTYNIGSSSSVSAPERSSYLRPYEKTTESLVYDGYRWHMAHYLDPIAISHFLITSENNDVDSSPLYQNPGWPTEAGVGPL